MVIPAITSTSAALPTRPITAPGVPTISPAPRLTHRRNTEADSDRGAEAESNSPSWLRPLRDVIGWSVRVAAGGCELATG